MNLIGMKFGRLEVISYASRKGYVVCKCDCGKIHEIRTAALTKSQNPTISCGCYRKEVSSSTGKSTIYRNSARLHAEMAKYGTNCRAISNPTPPRNNKSGYKGVWYDPARGRYQAYIVLHKKKYHLGSYKHLNEAINARQEAENRMFAPIIAAMKEEQLAR